MEPKEKYIIDEWDSQKMPDLGWATSKKPITEIRFSIRVYDADVERLLEVKRLCPDKTNSEIYSEALALYLDKLRGGIE